MPNTLCACQELRVGRLKERVGDFAFIQITTDEKSVLYEQVLVVNCFSLLGSLFLLLSLRLLLLSTGFVFAL